MQINAYHTCFQSKLSSNVHLNANNNPLHLFSLQVPVARKRPLFNPFTKFKNLCRQSTSLTVTFDTIDLSASLSWQHSVLDTQFLQRLYSLWSSSRVVVKSVLKLGFARRMLSFFFWGLSMYAKGGLCVTIQLLVISILCRMWIELSFII
jgi:hypothetical protein